MKALRIIPHFGFSTFFGDFLRQWILPISFRGIARLSKEYLSDLLLMRLLIASEKIYCVLLITN